MIRKLDEKLKPNSPAVQREPVLIEGSSDGYLKFFAGKNVDVLYINRPHCKTAQSAILAEQLIDELLPLRFANLFGADCLRGTAMLEKITANDLARRIHDVELIEALNEHKTPTQQIAKRVLAG